MITLDAKPLLNLRGLIQRPRGEIAVTALPGGLVTPMRGRGLEPAELRPFAPGDDPRHLDRNATARTGHLQVRLFHAERDHTTILLADFRPSMLWGTRRTLRSIAAAEALAMIGWNAVLSGGRVGLIAVSAADTIMLSPRGSDKAMVRMIGCMVRAHEEALAHANADDPPLDSALDLARRAAPRGAELWLASSLDSLGQSFVDCMHALKARTRLQVVHVRDAFEEDLPPGQYRFATRTQPEGALGRPSGGSNAVDALERLGISHRNHAAHRAPAEQIAHA